MLRLYHLELVIKLHPTEFEAFDDRVRDGVSRFRYKKYQNQLKKLDYLCQNNITPPTVETNNQSDRTFAARTINLTKVEFNEKEMNLLGKGRKYAPAIKSKNKVENMVAEIEVALKSQGGSNNLVKETIKRKLTNYQEGNCKYEVDAPIIKSIKQKMLVNNIILTRADKGGSTVLMNKQEYVNKVGDFIYKERIQRLSKDPTSKYQAEIKKALKNTTAALSDRQKYQMTTMNPSAPCLYALLKTHKEEFPIRPVV